MPFAYRSKLGQLIALLRRQKGLSQAELAIAAGLAVNTVAGIEQGKRHDPPWSTIQRLAYGLGVDFGQLMTLNTFQLSKPAKDFQDGVPA